MLSQIKDIKHIERDFHSVALVIMPQGWDKGVLGVKNLFFPKMVMLHIKLKGMVSSNRIQVKFSPSGQTGDLVVGSKCQISVFSIAMGFLMAPHRLRILLVHFMTEDELLIPKNELLISKNY